MKKLAKKWDWILIAALLFISAMLLLLIMHKNTEGLTAVIEKDGKTVQRVDLRTLNGPVTVEIEGRMPVTVVLEPDGARIAQAACPDRLCVKAGKLTGAGQCAVCLPARVSLSLTGEKETDAVTG